MDAFKRSFLAWLCILTTSAAPVLAASCEHILLFDDSEACTYCPAQDCPDMLFTWWRPESNLVACQAPFYRAPECGNLSIFGDDGLVVSSETVALQISGFVKSVLLIDTREMIGFRDNLQAPLPAPRVNDVCGKDINSRGQLSLFSIQTRLQGLITGHSTGKIYPAGFVEIDFTGAWVNDGVRDVQVDLHNALGGATLRHAFIQLDWDGGSLLAGQFWHPLVPPEAPVTNPTTFDNAPFECVGRYPQIRFTGRPYTFVEFIFAAASQFDFKSNGPEGFSTKYLRRAIVPNLHAQVRLYGCDAVFGFSLDYKRLIPRLSTVFGGSVYSTRAGVSSLSAQAYGRYEYERFISTGIVTYASNLTDELLLGGYGVTSNNPKTNHETYSPIRYVAGIFDFYLRCCVEPGLTIGFTKNIGCHDCLYEIPGASGNDRFIIYGRGVIDSTFEQESLNAIDYAMTFAPRIKWHHESFTIASEIRLIRAAYGELTNKAKVINACPVNDIRFNVSLYCSF